LHQLAAGRVLKFQRAGVQHQSICHAQGLVVGVEVAAEDRVSQLRQMNTQLVGAAGDRFQQQTGTMVHALQYFESSECLFAPLVADFLSRSIGPVRRDWQIDFSPVLPDSTEHDGVVVLLYGALLELPADVSMGWFVQGNDHDARGVEI